MTRNIYLPSIVGRFEANMGAMTLETGSKKFSATDAPQRIQIQGESYLVGTFAENNARDAAVSLTMEHFTNPDIFLPLTLAALSKGANHAKPISSILALPISIMRDKERAEGIMSAIKSMLIGAHEVAEMGNPKNSSSNRRISPLRERRRSTPRFSMIRETAS